jgi:cephalosporin hydroxylase
MDPMEEFHEQKRANIAKLGADEQVRDLSKQWLGAVSRLRYCYHFSWLGVPVIQFPQDIVALQEIVWSVKPEVIIETGIAHGGSLILYASMMELIGGDGIVVGVDIDIRAHNRAAIDSHRLANRIRMVEGSSVADDTISAVERILGSRERGLVVLDSNHASDHVLAELRRYQRFVPAGSYLIVLDTIIDSMPADFSAGRPWGPGRGAGSAVKRFLSENDRFEIDSEYTDKLLVSAAPDGFLKCVKNP